MDNGNRQEKLYTIHEFMMSSDYIERKKEKKEKKKRKERKERRRRKKKKLCIFRRN